MKKLLALLIAFSLVFGLAACGGDDDIVCEGNEQLIEGVCVAPNEAPVFAGLTDETLFVGDTFDATAGVTATDPEDGDITADIVVLSQPNMNAAGTYTVSYSVTDSDGKTVVGTRTITVEVPNQLPVFTGVGEITITEGEFNPLYGVTATDPEDGDLTASITVTGTVDPSTIGTYTLTYTVTDSEGETTTVTRTVNVSDVPVNNLPEINGAADLVVVLNGTFDPLAGVTAFDYEDGDVTASIVVVSNDVDLTVAGEYTVEYSVTDADSETTTLTRTVKVNTLPELFLGTVVWDETNEVWVVTVDGDIVDFDVDSAAALDLMENVVAFDEEDGEVGVFVEGVIAKDVAGDFLVGEYVVVYSAYDADGFVNTVEITVTVTATGYDYPTGFYNYKFADTEIRHTFMAAAEKYLLETMYGGVPVFANGSFNLYSERLVLPVDNYVAVMGYGTGFATMTQDDSFVKMDDGLPGLADNYTYRTFITSNPTTLNQWLYQDANEALLMGDYLDALYVYHFNAEKTGYEVVPSMADGDPVPVGSHLTDTGKEVSKVWQINIKDGLTWYLHPDTETEEGVDTSLYDMDITAEDFVDTFKLALDKQWFRAISGGGDFINEATGIVNAKAYVDGAADWADVGIKLVDPDSDGVTSIEFTFINDMSDWNVRYWLSSFVMTPIQLDLYEDLGGNFLKAGAEGEDEGSYGTSATSIAYHGAFFMNYYEPDKIFKLLENPVYHDPNEYFYTGRNYAFIDDSAIRFQEFLDGKLEAVALPTEYYDDYKDNPGIRQVPGPTTFRIMINGTGDVAGQTALFPDSEWVPEPILANQNFKLAMYFAIDRQKLAEEVLKTSTTNMYLFSDAYLVDAELGVPYRSTTQGESVGTLFAPETNGYSPDAASAYFLYAIQELVDAGIYEQGESVNNMNEINLDLHIFSGSQAQVLFGNYIKSAFETVFVDFDNLIKVTIDVIPKEFPSIYYDYMMTGDFDLSIGGISGSTLDAASFLDVFCDDNRGGFTLNWGIDTSTANIKVTYTDFESVEHNEIWSFNAIAAVLNGEVYLQDGAEAVVPAVKDVEVTPTTVTFSVSEFNNPSFDNFSYTINYWLPGTGYVPIDDASFVDISFDTETVTVTGLKPYFDDYPTEYYGDYQIQIYWDYVGQHVDPTDPTSDLRRGTNTSPDVYMPEVVTVVSEVVTATGATLEITLNEDDFARAIVSIDVLDYSDYSDSGATVDFTDLSNVVITGLVAGTDYQIIFTFDDGNVGVYYISTPAA